MRRNVSATCTNHTVDSVLKHSDKHGLYISTIFPLFLHPFFIIQGTGALLNGVGAAVSQRILQKQLQQHRQCQQ